MFSAYFPFRADPGPCPVDDAPHTGCTSDSAIVIQQTPMRDTQLAQLPAPVAPSQPAAQEFSTKTYRGELRKGRKR